MPISTVTILGGGIAGLSAAIALTKFNKVEVQVFELRPTIQTIGGAINLTPFAMRYLDHLGVLDKLLPVSAEVPRIRIFSHRTGKELGVMDYSNTERLKHKGRRVLRTALVTALVERLKDLGVSVRYGMRATTIDARKEDISVTFESGEKVTSDILVGADGIHSFTRTSFVEPSRKPTYTGIAAAYGLVSASKISKPLPFETTGMYSGRLGSFLLSYYDEAKTQIYAAAVMETPEAKDRQGWKVENGRKKELEANILSRFGSSPVEAIDEVLKNVDEWFLYPVFKLASEGKWFEGKCLLIGDAAHAVCISWLTMLGIQLMLLQMPPQGESIGLALEDVILISRVLEARKESAPEDLFKHYESLRRDRIAKAQKEAEWRFEKIKDKGLVGGLMMEKFTGLWLWWTTDSREDELAFDVRDIEI